jgi:hypothetical protein
VTRRVVAVPVTVIDGCATPALYGVMTYPVIVALPFVGAVHEIVAFPVPAVATRPVGAPGSEGVPTLTVVIPAGPFPRAFTATTLNVYELPFVSPVTVHVLAGTQGAVQVSVCVFAICNTPPRYVVTTYFVIAEPLFAGNVHETAADVVDAIALTTGAVGAPTTMGCDTTTGLEPTKFFAATRNV